MEIRKKLLLPAICIALSGCSMTPDSWAEANKCGAADNISKSLVAICDGKSEDFVSRALLDGMTVFDHRLAILIHTSSIPGDFKDTLRDKGIIITHMSSSYNSIGGLISSVDQLVFLSQQKNIIRIEPQKTPRTRIKGRTHEL